MGIVLACLSTPFLVLALALGCPDRLRPGRWALPLVLALAGVAFVDGPGERLLLASLWMLYALKGVALLGLPRAEVQTFSRLGLLLYATVWPGVDPHPFRRRLEPDAGGLAWFLRGWVTMLAGLGAVAALAWWDAPSGLLGVAALLAGVHLGYSDVLSTLLRLAGYPVRRLFEDPLASRSLDDFWSRRWNRPFVEMNHVLFMTPLRRLLGKTGALVAAFGISGVLHEFALSWPPGAGYGGPLLYFVAQGALVRVEHRLRVGRWPTWLARLWTWTALLAPLPILFHEPFLETLVVPLYRGLHGVLTPELVLTLAGLGHFLVLAASFQVPARLGWHEELARLRPLNRKLMWTYGAFIVMMIVAFGLLTLLLRPEMLAGDRAAVALAGLIGGFWTCRILVDALYFSHEDWPEGPEFQVGHTMLTTLFVFLATVNLGLVAWHLR